MVFQKLTDMSAQSLQSLLAGKTITIYYKKDTDATSDILCTAVSLDAVKAFSPKIRKVFNKYPEDKSYTITGGANKNIYNRMEAMAAGPLIASVIGEVHTEFDDEKGSWTRAVAVKGIANAKFSGKLSKRAVDRYYAGKINKEFDDDVRRALAELKAAAQANREGIA